MTHLETERLRLERWAPEHEGLYARLAAEPAVMRYVGAGVPHGPEQAAERHAAVLAHWAEHGFGWRAAVDRATGVGVGLIALNVAEADELAPDDHEIGWWLDPAVWGRGLAVEGGRAIVAEAFGRVGAPSVVARVQPGNAASLGVAAALGLTEEGSAVDRFGNPVTILRLHKEDELTVE
jgi:RimJ/RimL family protein N-acetyltransferase